VPTTGFRHSDHFRPGSNAKRPAVAPRSGPHRPASCQESACRPVNRNRILERQPCRPPPRLPRRPTGTVAMGRPPVNRRTGFAAQTCIECQPLRLRLGLICLDCRATDVRVKTTRRWQPIDRNASNQSSAQKPAATSITLLLLRRGNSVAPSAPKVPRRHAERHSVKRLPVARSAHVRQARAAIALGTERAPARVVASLPRWTNREALGRSPMPSLA
jgi:hypothetical protein